MQSGTAHRRPQLRPQKTQATEIQFVTAYQCPQLRPQKTQATEIQFVTGYQRPQLRPQKEKNNKPQKYSLSLSTSTVETTPALCTFFCLWNYATCTYTSAKCIDKHLQYN